MSPEEVFAPISCDRVNHPAHYNSHPSGIECISVTEHLNFCLGNAVKYLWRADLKGGTEDLEKAVWYIKREIARRRFSPAAPLDKTVAQRIKLS